MHVNVDLDFIQQQLCYFLTQHKTLDGQKFHLIHTHIKSKQDVKKRRKKSCNGQVTLFPGISSARHFVSFEQCGPFSIWA